MVMGGSTRCHDRQVFAPDYHFDVDVATFRAIYFSRGARAKALAWKKITWGPSPQSLQEYRDESVRLSTHGKPSGVSLCVLWRHCKTVDVRVNEFRRVTDIEEWRGDVFTWWLWLLLIWFCLLREIWISRFMMTEITMSENNYSWTKHSLKIEQFYISAFKINIFIHV